MTCMPGNFCQQARRNYISCKQCMESHAISPGVAAVAKIKVGPALPSLNQLIEVLMSPSCVLRTLTLPSSGFCLSLSSR